MMPREEILVMSVEPRARTPMASECTVADPLFTVVVHSLAWPVFDEIVGELMDVDVVLGREDIEEFVSCPCPVDLL